MLQTGNALIFINDLACDQFHLRSASGEVQIFTAVHNRRTGRPHMDFLRTVFIEKLNRFPHLCAPNNAVIYEKKFLAPNEFRNRNQLHFCNPIPHGLIGWHEASRPCGCILDKRSCKWNAASVGVTNGVRNTRIRNAADIIHVRKLSVFHIVLRHDLTVFGTHHFYIHALVAGGGIPVIRPEEGTDLHLLRSLIENFVAVLGQTGDLPCLQFVAGFIPQFLVCKGFEREAVAV